MLDPRLKEAYDLIDHYNNVDHNVKLKFRESGDPHLLVTFFDVDDDKPVPLPSTKEEAEILRSLAIACCPGTFYGAQLQFEMGSTITGFRQYEGGPCRRKVVQCRFFFVERENGYEHSVTSDRHYVTYKLSPIYDSIKVYEV